MQAVVCYLVVVLYVGGFFGVFLFTVFKIVYFLGGFIVLL